MNKKIWDNLSHDNQTAIQRAADTTYRAPVMDSSADAQIADLRNDGATVRSLRPEELTSKYSAMAI
ncbi:TPA: hypothetical protein N2G31_001180 [Salmonella enterica]|nr:hypothetical protein [Salmonella enterica]